MLRPASVATYGGGVVSSPPRSSPKGVHVVKTAPQDWERGMSSDYIDRIRQAVKQAAIDDPLLSQAEVCQALRLSASTLGRMRKAGVGPEWTRMGGSIRYRKSAVIAFIEKSLASQD